MPLRQRATAPTPSWAARAPTRATTTSTACSWRGPRCEGLRARAPRAAPVRADARQPPGRPALRRHLDRRQHAPPGTTCDMSMPHGAEPGAVGPALRGPGHRRLRRRRRPAEHVRALDGPRRAAAVRARAHRQGQHRQGAVGLRRRGRGHLPARAASAATACCPICTRCSREASRDRPAAWRGRSSSPTRPTRALRAVDDAFLLGADLLVVANTAPASASGLAGPGRRRGRWRDASPGGRRAGDRDLPALYLRDGAVAAAGAGHAVRPTRRPLDEIELLVNADADGRAVGVLYEDAGDGQVYRDREYRVTRFGVVDGKVATSVVEGAWPAGAWRVVVR